MTAAFLNLMDDVELTDDDLTLLEDDAYNQFTTGWMQDDDKEDAELNN